MRITVHTNWIAWIVLMGLAAASFGLSYAHLGSFAAPVAFTIAVAKAATIAVIFMRFLDQPAASHLALAVAVLLMALLVGMVMADWRGPVPQTLSGGR